MDLPEMSNGNISKQSYNCYVCEKQGYRNERVLLAGKDANGKTVYLNLDETPHRHKGGNNIIAGQTSKPTTLATSADTILSELAKINAKLDRLLAVEGRDPIE